MLCSIVIPSHKTRSLSWMILNWIAIIAQCVLLPSVVAYVECIHFFRKPLLCRPITSHRRQANNYFQSYSQTTYALKEKDSDDDDAVTQKYIPLASSTDLYFMNQAICLAKIGYGNTFPNPAVGCVLVRHRNNTSSSSSRDDVVIGSGFHPMAGMPHAEIFALFEACGYVNDGSSAARSVMEDETTIDDHSMSNNVMNLLEVYKSNNGANELFKDRLVNWNVTAYVTLEPCCHTGQTPPCAFSLVASGIKRVVVGYRDPNPRVDGGGIQLLKNSKIDVYVLRSPEGSIITDDEQKVAQECAALVKYFVKRITPQMESVHSIFLDDTINGKRRRALRSYAGRLKVNGNIQEVSWPKDKRKSTRSNEVEEDVDCAQTVQISSRFLETVDHSLWDHEIVLLRLNNVVQKKKGALILSSRIGKILNAHVAQVIGHTALLYRPSIPPVLNLTSLVASMPD